MIIKNVKFKNISSYGNKLQELSFTDEGGLILLTGTNGAGKSTIQNAIDICIFNTGRGKNLTRIPLKDFPNRNNKNLFVNVDFLNQNGDTINIIRKIAPNDFKITVNEQDYTERFKLMNETQKENFIGFNYQTFKSFISLSMNDFLNFINLKAEDKRNLLNRLFNLDEIDNYFSITKELLNQNKKEIEKLSLEIINIDNDVKEYIILIKKHNLEITITNKSELKNQILTLKTKYETLEDDNILLKNKISDYQVLIQENKNNINLNDNDSIVKRTQLNELRKKIQIFQNGKCPYCDSDLNHDNHNVSLIDMKTKDDEIIKNININNSINNELKFKNTEFYKQNELINSALLNNIDIINDIKAEIRVLKNKFDTPEINTPSIIDDIKKLGIEAKKNKEFKLERINFLKQENLNLNELLLLFDEDGIRKNIIKSIIFIRHL